LDLPCVDSPRLLGMPNPIEYTTWHTSRIPPLIDKEPSPSHHPCSNSFSTLSWD
jgi:hypothetical protein